MADKIQVAVRVRPVFLQKKDVEIHWSWSEGVVFQSEPGTQKRIGNPYLFDQVFGTEAQNYKIFTKLVQPLIDSAMNGFNVTVLAYGQTASGKTYTMMGSQKELGIVQLAVERIFSLIEQHPERAFLLRCSYIEIYNETISDLLSSTHQKLKVQELAEGNVVVHNLIEMNVNTPDAVLKLMQQGNKQRKVGGTSMNERSSRSHTIFRIIVESVPRDEADRSDAAVIVSHINLVDLAGSEKASQTNATGDRFREGCAINTSLSALSLVIKQLSEGEGFVNFRDSKLTHILRASLGGNARTAIICNVTPTVLDETSSTLKFACSAKAVQNQPHVNEVLSDQALLRKYNNYIKDLEKKLKEKELEKKPEAIEEMQRLLQEKDMKINELKEQLVVSSDVASGRPECSLTSAQRSLRRMTWGGNRLKQELNLLVPTIFEVNTPPVPCSEKVPRTVAQVFASRQRTSNVSKSEMAIDEVPVELDSLDSETFLPAEMVFKSKSCDPIRKVDVSTMTDVKESPFKQSCVPSTPVPVLRERLQRMRMSLLNKEKENEDLREELEDLTNFTRLEQEIGVHVLTTAKNVASPESADHLHRALQTANDMEVLYLDTHRKLSELQTEFRTKEAEHENKIYSIQSDYKLRLETEISEKKRLAKELTDLRDKFDRLEKDHSEADTHLQVIGERHAKREADLRETLQEAWAQLEVLGQDPNDIKENSTAKQKLALVEQELLEMQKSNNEAQSRIASLTEELRQLKEAAVKDYDQMHDNSLNGMCLADELRDVFMNQECSFVSRSVHRTRKRPSSILSVALAKMDQSACILDSTEQENEPSKKSRFSIQSDLSEELDILEVKEIREYLVELQSVLVRYEADYEVLSQEKERLNNQLISAQNELANLREEKNKTEQLMKYRNDEKKLDTTEEMLDSSCFIEEQSYESDDQFVSLRDQLTDTRGSSIVAEISETAAQNLEKVEYSNKIKQLEEELTQMTERFELLQQDVEEKTTALKQKQRSLDAAQLAIEVLEQRCDERQNLLSNLNELNEKIHLLSEDSTFVTRELETTRKTLKEIHAEARVLSTAKQLLETQLEKANEELKVTYAKLETVDRADPPGQTDEESTRTERVPREDFDALNSELKESLKRIFQLEVSLEEKTAQLNVSYQKLEADRTRIRVLEQKEESVSKQMESFECTIQDLSSENVSLDKMIAQLQFELHSKEAELIHFRSTNQNIVPPESSSQNVEGTAHISHIIDDKTDEIQRLKEELARVTDSQHEQQEQLQHAEQRFHESQRELNEIRISLESMQSVNDDLVTKLSDNENFVCDLRKNLENTTERFDLLHSKLDSVQSEKSTLSERVRLMESQLECKEQEIGDLRRGLSEVHKEHDLSTQVLNSELKESLRQVFELETSLEEKTVQLNVSYQKLEADQAKIRILEQSEGEVSKQLESFQRTIQDLSAQNMKLDKMVAQFQSDLQSKEVELNNFHPLTQKIAMLESRLQEVDGETVNMSRIIDDKTDEIQRLKEELARVTDSQRDHKEQLQHAEQRFHERQRELSEIRISLESMQSVNDDLVMKLSDNENLVCDLRKNLENTTERFDLLHSKLDSVQSERSSLSEHVRLMETQLECKEQEIGDLRRGLSEVHKEHDLSTQVLNLELKESLRRAFELETSLEEKTVQLNVSYQKLEADQAKIRILEQNEGEVSKQLESFERTIQDLSAQNMKLDKMVVQFQSDLQSKEVELINLRSMTQKTALLESRLQDFNGETVNMSRIIDEKTGEIQRLEEELARVTNSHRDYQKQLQYAEQRLCERQCELDEIQISLQSTERVNDELVAKLSEKENLIFDLRKNLENSTQRFDLLHSKLESVQSERSSLSDRVRFLECQDQEIKDLRRALSEVHNERDLSTQLKQRLNSLQAQYDDAISQCQQLRLVRDEILTHQEQSRNEMLQLRCQLQMTVEEKAALEQYRIQSESQKEAILHDYRTVKNELNEKGNQLHVVQCQRDELSNQVRMLNDQIGEVRNKANTLASSSEFQVQRYSEGTVDRLKKELVEVRSKSEILQLNFETEEDHRKKKIERLEKELETVKQQYAKCREQFRLQRYRPHEEGTVSLPKPRVSTIVESISVQTDPIADKGFGFRWQMEQYVSDNERLRKKASELGERMEFYRDKLIKYRNLYFQTTGQDPQRPSSSSSNHSQPIERHLSSSSNCRENVADCPVFDSGRKPEKKTLVEYAVPTSISPQSVALQETHQEEMKPRISSGVARSGMTATSTTRWSGGKKESLTKEEMEKINNCNPS